MEQGGTLTLATANVRLDEDEARIFDHSEQTADVSFNVKLDLTEKVHTQFDVQYIKAQTSNYDILVAANSVAQVDYSTNGDGTPNPGSFYVGAGAILYHRSADGSPIVTLGAYPGSSIRAVVSAGM